eukprot:scaffold15382_cov188-Skeletonema_marinoi.AAC.1
MAKAIVSKYLGTTTKVTPISPPASSSLSTAEASTAADPLRPIKAAAPTSAAPANPPAVNEQSIKRMKTAEELKGYINKDLANFPPAFVVSGEYMKKNETASIESINLFGNRVAMETQGKIGEEIDRVQNSIRSVDYVDEVQVAADDLARDTRVDDGNERSSIGDETEPITISTVSAHARGDASNEGAQIKRETDNGEIQAEEAEKETMELELQSTIAQLAQLREDLVEKDELIAEKEKDLASTKSILRKIGMMANNKDEESNHEYGTALQPRYLGTES